MSLEKKKLLIFWEILGSNRGLDCYNYWNISLASNTKCFETIHFITSDVSNQLKDGLNNLPFSINILQAYTKIYDKKYNKIKRSYYLIKGFFRFFFQSLNLKKPNTEIYNHVNIYKLGILELVTVLIATVLKHKIFIVLHDVKNLKKNNQKITIFNKIIYKIINKCISKIFVHSMATKNELIHYNLNTQKIFYLQHWDFAIPLKNNKILYEHKISNSSFINPQKLVFLFFGQLNYNKGVDIIIESAKEIKLKYPQIAKKIKYRIIGRSANDFDFDLFMKSIVDFNLTDIIEVNSKFIPNEELEEEINYSNVILLPYRNVYNSGTIIKVIGYKKPIIYSNLPSFTNVIGDYNVGFKIEPNNSQLLAECILKFVDEPKLINEFSLQQDELFSNAFNYENQSILLKKLYEN